MRHRLHKARHGALAAATATLLCLVAAAAQLPPPIAPAAAQLTANGLALSKLRPNILSPHPMNTSMKNAKEVVVVTGENNELVIR